MSGVTILEQQHDFVTLLDFRDGALLHGIIPNLNICTNLALNSLFLLTYPSKYFSACHWTIIRDVSGNGTRE